MSSRKMVITIVSLLLFSMVACNLQVAPTGSPGAGEPTANLHSLVDQAVQQTFDVQTQVAQVVAQTLTAMAASTPEFTFTPSGTSSLAASPKPSDTPTLTFTFTPDTPRVSVSVGTNCRSGPGPSYDLLGVLPAGQMAEAVGRNASNDTWVIQLPSNPAVTCWLWGQYASMTGNWQLLPVIDTPPTPTPAASFLLAYSDTAVCPGASVEYNLQITNNGSMRWESNHVWITDNKINYTNDTVSNKFPRYTACDQTSADLNLDPGEVGYTAGYFLPTSFTNGDTIQATVRVCSKDNLAGVCLEKTITFVP